MSIQELPENRSGAIDPRLEIAYNSNCRVTIERAALHSADEHNVKWSDYMVENENYKSYTANNGTDASLSQEWVVQMTAEQRVCYQNFINVRHNLIKYAAAEKENQKAEQSIPAVE
ncbi:MAG: hypothetical protein V8Q82_04050 [Christensenellales bacterium]